MRRHIDRQGYARLYTGGRSPRWVYAHRWVMEQALGRPLRRDEHVHHRNGQKDDNRPGLCTQRPANG